MKKRWTAWLCVLMLLLTACSHELPSEQTPEKEPSAEGETVRAVWIPYMEIEELLVSRDPETCRAAIAACLDDCVAKGVNTVYFHVRPNSDAYYDSAVFAPNPTTAALLAKGFDPLRTAVEAAHERGMSLHAWVNPYRVGTDAARAKVSAVFEYGERYYYVPSDEAVHALIVSGVLEIVTNYAVDGVQFDDYFYPSGVVAADAPAAFEEAAFTAYTNAGGALAIGDWRRAKVSALIAACYDSCHSRESCVFGVSPAYDLQSNRDTLYADVERWACTAGYVDYLCPQLYFGFAHEYAPFETILNTWHTLPRDASVSLVAGLGLYKTGLAEDTYAGSGRYEWAANDDIIARQIALVKTLSWNGIALYSHQSFVCTEDRDTAIVNEETQAACNAWRDET